MGVGVGMGVGVAVGVGMGVGMGVGPGSELRGPSPQVSSEELLGWGPRFTPCPQGERCMRGRERGSGRRPRPLESAHHTLMGSVS